MPMSDLRGEGAIRKALKRRRRELVADRTAELVLKQLKQHSNSVDKVLFKRVLTNAFKSK